MFKTKSASLSSIAFGMLTAYMGRAGLMLFAVDLDDAEVKAAIKEAVEAAVKPLTEKRDELLSEVKQLRKGKQVSPEDLDKLETENSNLKDQLDKANKDLKVANGTAEKATKQLEAAEGFNRQLLVDNGLNEALTKAGVTNAAFLKASRTILAGQVQIVTDGDQRVAKVGDKALGDFVSEWAKSEEGKHFVAAPGNSGGSANGGSGQGNAKTMTRAAFDAAGATERADFARSGGQVVD